MLLNTLHPSFNLNGQNFTNKTLIIYAKELIAHGEEYEIAIGKFICEWLNNELFVKVTTSGSTGVPKTLDVTKQHMMNSAKATGDFFNMQAGSKVLLCLSANYIAGKMMLVRAMVLGWQLDAVVPQTNPLQGIRTTYDFSAMVPMQLKNAIKEINNIKKVIIGGAPIPESLGHQIQAKKAKIYETYGMTETVSHIAVRRVNSKKRAFEEAYFKALPNVTLSTDDRRCLVVDAPLVSKGNIVTNDIVKLISPKKFKWKGRFDTIINSGGVKLYPEEIERKLQSVIKHRFIISWLPDEVLGQRLILLIEDSLLVLKAEEIFNRIKLINTLKKYELPKQVFFLKEFKETDSGKVHREKNRNRI